MSRNQDLLEMTKAILNYTDDEMKTVASNPKYMQMLEKVPQLINTDFIFEVDEARGCACQHQKGQKIKINGDGSITCEESAPKICVYLLNAIIPIVYGAQEFIFEGLDPNTLKFTKFGCFDNGAKCGGFGHVTVKFSSQQRESLSGLRPK
jgi:uncharacterized repeat protein (TIGR04076 family)